MRKAATVPYVPCLALFISTCLLISAASVELLDGRNMPQTANVSTPPLAAHHIRPTLNPTHRHLPLPTAPRSRYASTGAAKPYVGAVDTLDQLNASLTSCSFQREIIMVPSTEDNIDAAAQTMWTLG